MKIKGKVWVVTGGGSGMGRELVLQLLAKGAKVATCDIHQEAMEETLSLAGNLSSNLSMCWILLIRKRFPTFQKK